MSSVTSHVPFIPEAPASVVLHGQSFIPTAPASVENAKAQIGIFREHAIAMVGNLQQQHSSLGISSEKLQRIYAQAQQKIEAIHQRLSATIGSAEGAMVNINEMPEMPQVVEALLRGEIDISRLTLNGAERAQLESWMSGCRNQQIQLFHMEGQKEALEQKLKTVSEAHVPVTVEMRKLITIQSEIQQLRVSVQRSRRMIGEFLVNKEQLPLLQVDLILDASAEAKNSGNVPIAVDKQLALIKLSKNLQRTIEQSAGYAAERDSFAKEYWEVEAALTPTGSSTADLRASALNELESKRDQAHQKYLKSQEAVDALFKELGTLGAEFGRKDSHLELAELRRALQRETKESARHVVTRDSYEKQYEKIKAAHDTLLLTGNAEENLQKSASTLKELEKQQEEAYLQYEYSQQQVRGLLEGLKKWGTHFNSGDIHVRLVQLRKELHRATDESTHRAAERDSFAQNCKVAQSRLTTIITAEKELPKAEKVLLEQEESLNEKNNQKTKLQDQLSLLGDAESLPQIQKESRASIKKELEQLQTTVTTLEQEIKEQRTHIAGLKKEVEQKASVQSDLAKWEQKRDKAVQQYEKSQEQMGSLLTRLERLGTDFGTRDIHRLEHALQRAESEIVTLVRDAQVEVARAVAEELEPESSTQISAWHLASLGAKGWRGHWIRRMAEGPFAIKSYQVAVKVFNRMAAAARFPINEPTAEMDSQRADEFVEFQRTGTLERRAGVIGVKGVYRFQAVFSRAQIKGQLHSFRVQKLSEQPRMKIEKELQIGVQFFHNTLMPLNTTFDAWINIKVQNAVMDFFGKIFGNKGISSLNRQEPHLVNGYDSQLTSVDSQKTLFSALRHAITVDINEKDPEIRQANSKQAAKELITAALLKELKNRGVTSLEEFANSGKRLALHLNSVSLVTPDDIRPALNRMNIHQEDERAMLNDQLTALHAWEEVKEWELNGVKIAVELKVNGFNFGVNRGAVDWDLGLDNQYAINKRAMEGLREDVNAFCRKADETLGPTKEPSPELVLAKQNVETLMRDIEAMMEDEKAYLEYLKGDKENGGKEKGRNQYEIGAKILNLTHLMSTNIRPSPNEEENIPGLQGAFNCKSGKDRTGIMDGVAKTLAVMAEERGGGDQGLHYSHQEFMAQPELKKRFAQILVPLLLEGGGLEITAQNTGMIGYKVQQEARLFGMPLEQFLTLQGFSALAPG